jgi:hypothetical protein
MIRADFGAIAVQNIPAVKNLLAVYYSDDKSPKTVVQHGSKMCCNHTAVHPVTIVNPLHLF